MALTGKKSHRITREALEEHYDIPLADVARKFDVCLTYLKKICRGHGIKHWPYRKRKAKRNGCKTLQPVTPYTDIGDQSTSVISEGTVKVTTAATDGTTQDVSYDQGEVLLMCAHSAKDPMVRIPQKLLQSVGLGSIHS